MIRKILLTFVMSSIFTGAAFAIQPSIESIRRESDGTSTYFFKIKIDETVKVEGGTAPPNPDFFTIFNFLGMVPGSEKQPAGWSFSTSTNGVSPIRGGRVIINPVDTPDIPNLTWSRSGGTLSGPMEISGFSVRTTVAETMVGEYGSQVTRVKPGTLKPKTVMELKEGRIGAITTPLMP